MQHVIKRIGKNYGFVYSSWISYSTIFPDYLAPGQPTMAWKHIGSLEQEMIWTSSFGTHLAQQSVYHINSAGASADWYPSNHIIDQWVYTVQRPALYKNHSTKQQELLCNMQ